jgi:uroporphyrinogen decarboxylase
MEERKGAMTERQRIDALLKRQKPDKVPHWPFFDMTGFAAIYQNRPIIDAYKDPKVYLELQRKVCQDFNWICSPLFMGFGVEEFGGERKLPESEFSQAPMTTRYQVESEEDVYKLKLPDLKKSVGMARDTEFQMLMREDKPDIEPFNNFVLIMGSPYDYAAMLCGAERIGRWVMKKPELMDDLLRASSDIVMGIAQYWYDTLGTEGVLLLSGGVFSSNDLISPQQFERFVLPYLKECHQKMLDMGFERFYCHICGEHNPNLPYWPEVPMGDPGIVSFGHEVDLETAAKYFPNDIILGNLEPAILQMATPEETYEATRKVVEKGKKAPGGDIFAVGCQFPPRAKLENVKAMNQALDDFGWY